MTKIPNNKPTYDLEERAFQFDKSVRLLVKTLPRSNGNTNDHFAKYQRIGGVGSMKDLPRNLACKALKRELRGPNCEEKENKIIRRAGSWILDIF